MRIICSPAVSAADEDAIRAGYDRRSEEHFAEGLRQEIARLLADPNLSKPTRVLAALVALGVIDVQIAFMDGSSDPRHHRLFHDKVGIFRDAERNIVVFKGSMNETWTALSADGNLESVDVFLSWEHAREALRVKAECDYFDSLWRNEYPTTTVKTFPSVAREELLKSADIEHWPELLEEICQDMKVATTLAVEGISVGRTPRPHQRAALDAWNAAGRRGIFEHATGSGKTFTALCAARDAVAGGEVPVILVPSEHLLAQWYSEILDTFSISPPDILRCGAGHTKWRDDRLLRPWTRSRTGGSSRIVLATMQTACREEFRRTVEQGPHLFLIADEVHRLGSPEHRQILSINAGPRLGLSATPRRAGDPDGTRAIFTYFQGVIPPPFTLEDAIRTRTLTPYFYYVHPVELTQEEEEHWREITNRIRQIFARTVKATQSDPAADARIQQMLIDRARIVKAAQNKIATAVEVVQEYYHKGDRWIIYCDSVPQLRQVLQALQGRGFYCSEYHSDMAGDRGGTLHHFDVNGGIVVSIRCLDEGVDIPSVTHALILASSKNPREFIQRRGRVLRKAPGKALAHVHDTIVIPKDPEQVNPNLAILEGELARAVEFGRHAQNPSSITELERIAVQFGIDHTLLLNQGYESDE